MTELDAETGLEIIDLEASTLLHIDISIYSALSEIPRRAFCFSLLKRVINKQK